MKSLNCLGIYISTNMATVVCLGFQNNSDRILGHFTVSIEDQEQQDMQSLVNLVAQGCKERGWKFSDVTLALDCAMVMQHSVHSEFNDPRRIRATIRFDTEEALATDISEVGLAFEITSTDETGSELTVFTSKQSVLSEILTAFQRNNIDPAIMEPDVNGLSRFINKKAIPGESEQDGILYGFLSQHNGYLIIPAGSDTEATQKGSVVRTFLIGSGQDRNQLLSREVLVTAALVESNQQVSTLKVFDSTGSVDCRQLGERVGFAGEKFDLSGNSGIDISGNSGEADPVDFMIAYGAALANLEKVGHIANFRDDFNPYQGRKIKMQKALKFAAVSVGILLFAAGLYFHLHLMDINQNRNRLRGKFALDYSTVTLDKLDSDTTFKEAVKELGKIYRRVEAEKKGLVTDEKSVSSKLTLILSAFNECAEKTDLNIKSITISSRDIIITGDTASRSSNTMLFAVIRDSGLEILKPSYAPAGDRDSFSLTLRPMN